MKDENMKNLEYKRHSLTFQGKTILWPHQPGLLSSGCQTLLTPLRWKNITVVSFPSCYLFFGDFLKMDSFCVWLFNATSMSNTFFFFLFWAILFLQLGTGGEWRPPWCPGSCRPSFSIFQRAQANLPIMSLESEDEVPANMTQISLLLLLISS